MPKAPGLPCIPKFVAEGGDKLISEFACMCLVRSRLLRYILVVDACMLFGDTEPNPHESHDDHRWVSGVPVHSVDALTDRLEWPRLAFICEEEADMEEHLAIFGHGRQTDEEATAQCRLQPPSVRLLADVICRAPWVRRAAQKLARAATGYKPNPAAHLAFLEHMLNSRSPPHAHAQPTDCYERATNTLRREILNLRMALALDGNAATPAASSSAPASAANEEKRSRDEGDEAGEADEADDTDEVGKKEDEKEGEKKHKRPRGRARKGMAWNSTVGQWECDNDVQKATPCTPAAKSTNSANSANSTPAANPRPRGRAPTGKKWNATRGVWENNAHIVLTEVHPDAEAQAEAQAEEQAEEQAEAQERLLMTLANKDADVPTNAKKFKMQHLKMIHTIVLDILQEPHAEAKTFDDMHKDMRKAQVWSHPDKWTPDNKDPAEKAFRILTFTINFLKCEIEKAKPIVLD